MRFLKHHGLNLAYPYFNLRAKPDLIVNILILYVFLDSYKKSGSRQAGGKKTDEVCAA